MLYSKAPSAESSKSLKSFPIYPILFVFYFFLHLWAANLDKGIDPVKFFHPFVLSVAWTLGVWIFLGLIYWNLERASWVLSLMLLLFFGYGHLFNIELSKIPIHPRIIAGFFVFLFLAIPIVFHPKMVWKLRPQKHWAHTYLNITAGLLVLFPLTAILTTHYAPAAILRAPQNEPLQIEKSPRIYPDVYYIILDEYGRADVLQKEFHLDNTPFIDFLKTRGFYVADKSTSNYTLTIYSIPSSLNMRYLIPGEQDILEILEDNRISQIFKRLGYDYIFVGSGVDFTEYSHTADEVINYLGVNEAQLLVVNSTLLRAYSGFLLGQSWRNRHLHNFEELGKVPYREGRKFTFAHFVIPHPPFVFSRDGSPNITFGLKLNPNLVFTQYREKYPEQLLYLNTLVEKLVRDLQSRSQTPPIIVLQSDHGIDPLTENWHAPEAYRKRVANFTAVYAPKEVLDKFYPEITPVNIFRIIFKEYFGASLKLLPDQNFISRDISWDQEEGGTEWKDMTAVVRK